MFEENCVTEGIYKGNKCHFMEGKLSHHHPTHCKVCGTVNEDYMIYKNGTQTSRFTIPAESVYPFYLIQKNNVFSVNLVSHLLLQRLTSFKNIVSFPIKFKAQETKSKQKKTHVKAS